MNNFGKTVLIGGAGALLAYVGYKGVKSYIETKKQLDKKDQEEETELKKSGLSRERVREIMIPEVDDLNLVKKLYLSVLHNPEFDIDIFDIDKCLDAGHKTIHVRQDKSNQFFELLLEIPGTVFTERGNYLLPTIGNYVSAYSSLSRELGEEVIKFTPTPHHNLVGYFVLTDKVIDGKEVHPDKASQQYFRIPREVYSEFADQQHDGLTKYIEQFLLQRQNGGFEDTEDGKAVLRMQGDEYYIEDVVLMSKISMPIQHNSGTFELGVNLESAVKCLKYALDNLEIKRNPRQAQEGIRPTNIMFHSWDGDSWDMFGYYEEQGDGEITVGTYTSRQA